MVYQRLSGFDDPAFRSSQRQADSVLIRTKLQDRLLSPSIFYPMAHRRHPRRLSSLQRLPQRHERITPTLIPSCHMVPTPPNLLPQSYQAVQLENVLTGKKLHFGVGDLL